MFSLQGSIHHHTTGRTGNGGDDDDLFISVTENKNKTCGVPSRRLCAMRTRSGAGSGMTQSGKRFSWRVALRQLQGYGSGWTASGKRYSARLARLANRTTTSSTCPFVFSSILFLSPQRQRQKQRQRRRRQGRQGRQLQSPNVADAVSDEDQDFDADFTATTDVAGEAGPPYRQLEAGWVSMGSGKRRKLDTLRESGNNGSTQSDPFAFRRGYVCVLTTCGKRFKASLHV